MQKVSSSEEKTEQEKKEKEKREILRIPMRVDGLQKKLKDFSDTLKKYEPQRRKFIDTKIQHAKANFEKAKGDLESAREKCKRVKSRSVNARDNARRLSDKTSRSWNKRGSSETSKLTAKSEYLTSIIENLRDIEENLKKMEKVFNKIFQGAFKQINLEKFCIPDKIFTSLDALDKKLKEVKEKSAEKALSDVQRTQLDKAMDQIEKGIKEIGIYTFDPAYRTFQTGVMRVVSKDYMPKPMREPSEKEFEEDTEGKKFSAALEGTKVTLRSQYVVRDAPAKNKISYLEAVECLGNIDGLSVKVSEYAKGMKNELKEYSKQVDHLLVTFRGVMRLTGKIIFKLLPAIVGCAAGASGFFKALEETFVETIGWLSSAIGYGAFDIEGLKVELGEWTDVVHKLSVD